MVKKISKKIFILILASVVLFVPNKVDAGPGSAPLSTISARDFQVATISFLLNYRANKTSYCDREKNWSGSCLSSKIIAEIYVWLLDPNNDGLYQDSYFNISASKDRQTWLTNQLNSHKVKHPFVVGKIFLPWERSKQYKIRQVDVFANLNASLYESYFNSLADSLDPNLKIPSDLGGLFKIQQLVFLEGFEKTAPNGKKYPVFDLQPKSSLWHLLDITDILEPGSQPKKSTLDEVYETPMMQPYAANRRLRDWTSQEIAVLTKAKDFLNLTYQTMASMDLGSPKNAQAQQKAMAQVAGISRVAGIAKVSSKKNGLFSPVLTVTVNGSQTPLPWILVRSFASGCSLNNAEASGAVVYIDRRYQGLKKRLKGLLPKIPDNPWYIFNQGAFDTVCRKLGSAEGTYYRPSLIALDESLFKGKLQVGPGEAVVINHEFLHLLRDLNGVGTSFLKGHSEEIVNEWLNQQIFSDFSKNAWYGGLYTPDLIDRFLGHSSSSNVEREKNAGLLKKAFLKGCFDCFGDIVKKPGIWPEFKAKIDALDYPRSGEKLSREATFKKYVQNVLDLRKWIDNLYR